MKINLHHIKSIILFSLVAILVSCNAPQNDTIELWYNTPAQNWEEALPIGNGRLGAMIYGNPYEEHIQFNEETLWDGRPRSYQREDAYKYLPTIRRLIAIGKQKEAEKLANEHFMSRLDYETTFPIEKKQWVDSILKLTDVQEAIKANFDDSEWPSMLIDYKSVWERKGLPDMNGAVLFRKTVDFPDALTGKKLVINLGKIKDHDFTYINGHLIGTKDESNTNRSYTIPAKYIKKGKNTITVLINNYVSTGGFNAVRTGSKKMNITTTQLSNDSVYIEGDWKYKVIDTEPPYYPQYQSDYQPFGDVMIKFNHTDTVSSYRRNLNLNKALATTQYTIDDTKYKMEYLASHPDDIIAVNITASQKQHINFSAYFTTLHPIHRTYKVDDNTLALELKVEDGDMKGTAYLHIESNDGEVTVDEKSIAVSNASQATLKLMAATNYKSYKDISGNPALNCDATLEACKSIDFNTIKNAHLVDYTKLYNRFSISLGGKEKRDIPTNQRIIDVAKQSDNDLAATYVQYARYLMLSSGREGTNPPNLQGIWNDKIYPAWGSKYTTNINCEMNFWPVEPLNIGECHQTLFKMIDELSQEGAKTAKCYYNARGWVHHHNTDQWRGTAPINNSNHGIWVTGGAWLCQHLWEHYLYSQDTTFLKEQAYPIMKGAAEFFVDFLVKDPKTGYLISTPSNSPEHGGLVAGPAMDHQIIRALFSNMIESSSILNIDKEFSDTLQQKLSQIAPDHIGEHGQLQEWLEDKDDITDHHRHLSHLWAVHPGNEITWNKTPELMQAAKQSLIYRGDDGTGWSLAWKINFWARFLDGDHANTMIKMLMSSALDPERTSDGGSYPNLFDSHPPFQIDGNFGGAAGIIEMLVQSHEEYIQLLPALPSDWSEGEINGLRCRGGFELSMKWENGQLTEANMKSLAGKPLHVKYGDTVVNMETASGETYALKPLF